MFKTEIRKRAGRTLTALVTAIAMTATLAVPAVNAAPVSAAEKDLTVRTEQLAAGTYTETNDLPLDTTEKIATKISNFGNTILNSNGELWYRMKMGTAKYQKKTGIAKAYERVYLDTKGNASFLKEDNTTAARENVKDIGRFSLLLTDGTLIDTYTNQVIDTQVKAWYEAEARDGQKSLLLKENGDVYLFANGRLGGKMNTVSNVTEVSRNALLDKDGNLYNLSFGYDENTYEENVYRLVQGNKNVQKLAILRDELNAYVNCMYIKDGQSYSGDDNQQILEKEAVACKSYSTDHESGSLFATAGGSVYKAIQSWDDNDNAVWQPARKIADNFDRFTGKGYRLKDGTYYDEMGKKTDIIQQQALYSYGSAEEDYSETFVGNLQFKTDHCLYLNNQKLLTNVAECNTFFDSLPLVLTRTDGTTWLYDWQDPDPEYDLRKRIDPPQKLTEELVAAVYNGSTVPEKKAQTISGTSSFTKTYGDKAFNLGAKSSGDGKLTYKSSNTKVAAVSSAGTVTLKGPGKATITITASETDKYKAASKTVAITVKEAAKPKKMAAPQVKSAKTKTLAVSWKKDTKASGYQVVIAQNSKFTKGKKTATITSNKTTSATFKKLAKGKTYYAKVRAYKKVGTTKLYGAYSSVKKVKVK